MFQTNGTLSALSHFNHKFGNKFLDANKGKLWVFSSSNQLILKYKLFLKVWYQLKGYYWYEILKMRIFCFFFFWRDGLNHSSNIENKLVFKRLLLKIEDFISIQRKTNHELKSQAHSDCSFLLTFAWRMAIVAPANPRIVSTNDKRPKSSDKISKRPEGHARHPNTSQPCPADAATTVDSNRDACTAIVDAPDDDDELIEMRRNKSIWANENNNWKQQRRRTSAEFSGVRWHVQCVQW